MFLRHLLFHEGCTSDYSTGRSDQPVVVVTGRTSRLVSVRAVAHEYDTRACRITCASGSRLSTLRLCDRRQRQNAVSNKPVHRISSCHTYGFVHCINGAQREYAAGRPDGVYRSIAARGRVAPPAGVGLLRTSLPVISPRDWRA